MDNEQTIITTQETQVTESVTTEPETKTEITEPTIYKSFNTEEDYKKEIQSVRSKAKYEILKDLGIENVDQFKNLKATNDDLINKYNNVTEEIKQLKQDQLLDKLQVEENKRKEFLLLAGSLEGKSLEEAANVLRVDYPKLFKQTQERVNIGTDKGSETKSQSDNVSQALKEKFPWLK